MQNNYSIIKISASFGQTTIVATDNFNNVLAWGSTAFTRRNVAELNYNTSKMIAVKLKELGIDNADIVVKGHGMGREYAIKAIMDNGITINMIKDQTPIPHNGAIPLKRSRKKQQSTL